MSKETLPQQPNNEEVDLGQLFDAIGKLFERLYNFVVSIFEFIFKVIILGSRAVIENFKLIVVVMVIAAAAGFGLEKVSKQSYDSTMLVRTFFDTKYQLHTNLNYYNALIGEERYDTLGEIFELPADSLVQIVEFEIAPGPETENDRIVQYDRFITSIDSVRAQEISYDDYIENRGIFAGSVFEIRVESKSRNIFKSLEKGIIKSFNNLYSVKKMEQRDSMISLRRQNLMTSIAEIDSLQNVYINVLEEESQSTKATISLGDGFPLQQEKTSTKEYQLLNKEIELRNELRALDEEKVEQNEFYEIISTFQEVGNVLDDIMTKYMILFPLLAFGLMVLGYLTKNYISFIKNYEV